MPVYPSDLNKRFDVTDLVGQFILCKSEEYTPPGWPVARQGNWLLSNHPVLPVVPMENSQASPLGWLIGYPISADGELLTEKATFDVEEDDGVFCERFETLLYAMGGRFAAVVFGGGESRVYLDPMGSLSAVYSPAHDIVCSTPPLIPYTKGCEDDRELIDATGIPDRNSFYAFGLTPRRSVHRIQTNHYLDLSTWETRRHWPQDPLEPDDDVETAALRIAELIKRQIAAVAARHLVHMSLTAGHDSRLLLGCARGCIDRVSLFTHRLDASADLDCRVARALTRKVGLELNILKYLETDENELAKWLYRSGCCIGELRGWKALRTYRQLDPRRAELPGDGGETGGVTFWRRRHTETSPVDNEELVERFRVPATPEILRRAREWRDGLPFTNTLRVIDLMYIEARLGGWAGLLPYADPVSTAFRVYPVCHREILERMLRLPTPYRRSRALPSDILQREWPELLGIPYNENIGWRRQVELAAINLKRLKKAVVSPGWALRKTRERLFR